ncbi:MAG: ribosome-associated translation inhibitor RaiA [Gemmatimonadetes bacterium]|jgi:ribosomal subunit interface protein|nr:ribosome-associated translation inhibitor RaiA [Gemmatimonadota bacterium]MBT7863472.1 ribosome-associated translation inhibitor RaiA [Gemmatimonadota bacterium]
MPVRIDAKGSKLSESTKDHIEECCAKLNQFFDKITDIEVILDTQDKHKHATTVEIIVRVPGQRLAGTGETSDDNLFRAIDEAISKTETQLRKYHDKLVDHR